MCKAYAIASVDRTTAFREKIVSISRCTDGVVLARNHEWKLRFRHNGGALPGGSSVLPVREDRGTSTARKKETIGSEWSSFVKPRVNTLVTLYKEEGDD
ncbi:hypothetical protein Gohar_009886 [Gossypium harknessii]|uniref:Uncharacterized protein n=1 Tax=Gossypium harknessii TaxID=34285 RepID=A0A7J9GRF6_9ROSI|nr:hypothetical protein [Gossypium harknessii]